MLQVFIYPNQLRESFKKHVLFSHNYSFIVDKIFSPRSLRFSIESSPYDIRRGLQPRPGSLTLLEKNKKSGRKGRNIN